MGRKNIAKGRNIQLSDFSHLITKVGESSEIKVEKRKDEEE